MNFRISSSQGIDAALLINVMILVESITVVTERVQEFFPADIQTDLDEDTLNEAAVRADDYFLTH